MKKIGIVEEWQEHLNTSNSIESNMRHLWSLGFKACRKNVKENVEFKREKEEEEKRQIIQLKEEKTLKIEKEKDERFAVASTYVVKEDTFNMLKNEWLRYEDDISFVRELHSRLSNEWSNLTQAILGNNKNRGLISDNSICVEERIRIHRLCVFSFLLKDLRKDDYKLRDTSKYELTEAELTVQYNFNKIFDNLGSTVREVEEILGEIELLDTELVAVETVKYS